MNEMEKKKYRLAKRFALVTTLNAHAALQMMNDKDVDAIQEFFDCVDEVKGQVAD